MGLRDFLRRLLGLQRHRRTDLSARRHRQRPIPRGPHARAGGRSPKSAPPPRLERNYTQHRESIYRELFGTPVDVSRESFPYIPEIDVYQFAPQRGRDFTMFITGGMSDLPMNAPPGFEQECSRGELVMYVEKPKDAYVGLLRRLAHMVHDSESWFWIGHLIPNHDPPTPIFPGSGLDHVLLLRPPLRPERLLPHRLRIDRQMVNFLWVCPVTQAEAQERLERDGGEDAPAEPRFPTVFNEGRPSLV